MTSTLLTPIDADWDRIVADITRREFVVGGVSLAALLAACGSDDSSTATSAPTASTRRVTHSFGTSEIPADPHRVVALDGRVCFEHALALGFAPVVTGEDALVDGAVDSFIDFDIEGVPLVNPRAVNFEIVAKASPDLIIARDFDLEVETQLERLVEIAPILPVTWSDRWRVQLEGLAAWLQREEQAAAVLTAYDAHAAAIRERHARAIPATTVGMVTWNPTESSLGSLHSEDWMVHRQVLTDLGGVESEFLVSVANDAPWFSIENVDQIADVDALLVVHFEPEAGRRSLDAQPLWRRLPAVQRGNVVYADTRTNYGGAYSARRCLDLFDQLYDTLG